MSRDCCRTKLPDDVTDRNVQMVLRWLAKASCLFLYWMVMSRAVP